MIDYIIVGFGLAGLAFVEKLEKNNKSYIVYENFSQKSSRVAGGLYNPVILKRFTLAWFASEQLALAVPFYKNIQEKLTTSLLFELPVLRRFNSVEEQNQWFEACDRPVLDRFLSPHLIRNENDALDISFHYGKVNYTGRIDVKKMLSTYLKNIEKEKKLRKESFDYDHLVVADDIIEYKGVKARNIIFTEGYGIKKNPFFNYLPVLGNKGEYITIRSKQLELQEAVKSSIFIIPLGKDLYKVGATYNNNDKTQETTKSAREELQDKLERFLKVPYQIVNQEAGIRPTTKDRRPLIGTHPLYKNMHIINGLGSRGILIGPYAAGKLYDLIENKKLLDKEIDIKRFEKLR
ncbi:NAD(P)/FAD-dependent oxidoreductase [Aquimarina sp. M1]